MGSKTVAVTIVMNSLQVSQGSTMNECSVESAVTEFKIGCSTNANSPVLGPVNNPARQATLTVWKMLEHAILLTIIAMVWGLLALPIAVYHVVSSLQTFQRL